MEFKLILAGISPNMFQCEEVPVIQLKESEPYLSLGFEYIEDIREDHGPDIPLENFDTVFKIPGIKYDINKGMFCVDFLTVIVPEHIASKLDVYKKANIYRHTITPIEILKFVKSEIVVSEDKDSEMKNNKHVCLSVYIDESNLIKYVFNL